MSKDVEARKPYPFCLTHPLEQEPAALGEVSQWLAEWSWNGIRSQIITQEGKTFIWTHGEELVSERFPELLAAAKLLPDGTAIDGVILAWAEGEVLPVDLLQKRSQCDKSSPELVQEIPVAFMSFDILELDGVDIREKPLSQRRRTLVQLLSPGALDAYPSCRGQVHSSFRISPDLIVSNWDELSELLSMSRDLKVDGIILKGAESPYATASGKGDWWKWT